MVLTHTYTHTRVSDGLKPGLLLLLGEIRWEIWWRRKRCCGSAHNLFIPHYVAAIQYSAKVEGNALGMQSRMNKMHETKLKQEPLWV